RRAFVNFGDLGVAHQLLDAEVPDVPVPTVDLHRLHSGAHGRLAGQQLGHGDLLGVPPAGAPALVVQDGGPVDHQACSLNLGGHVGQLELDGLEVGDGPAELLALLGVAQRLVQGGLGDAHSLGGDTHPAVVQGCQGDAVALALGPD